MFVTDSSNLSPISWYHKSSLFSLYGTVWLLCSGCFLTKTLAPYTLSHRDRFAKQAVDGPSALRPKLTAAIAGKPDASDQADHRVVALPPGSQLVLQMDLPAYAGHSESLTLHIPKTWEHEGDCRVSIAGSAQGPWIPVGLASKTHTFDIDGTPMEVSRFVRIEVLASTRTQLWLDAVQLRVHTKDWKPPLQDRPALPPKEAKREAQQFQRLWQQGQQAFQERQWTQARSYWREALTLRPRHPQLLLMLGATYHALERHYQAIRHYQQAFQYVTPSREHLEEVADSYLALQFPNLAKPYVEQCIDHDPFYLSCYNKRLHLASLEKNRLELAFYREWYHIVKNRDHIAQRQLSFHPFLAKYFDRGMPLITRHPEVFRCNQHLSWLQFLLRLFPQDTPALMSFTRPGLWKRVQELKTPPSRREGQYYQALYGYRVKQPVDSLRLLDTLVHQEKRPIWLQKIYLLRGQILEEQGKTKQAQRLYKQAHQRLLNSPYGHIFFIKTMGKQISSALHTP